MSENNNKSVGEIIKEVIIEKGLNQSLIAKKMNVSRQVINQLDKRKNIDYSFLKDLQAATEIDFTKYMPIPEYLKDTITSKVEFSEPKMSYDKSENRGTDQGAQLTLNFRIAPESFGNISEFMKEVNAAAAKLGIQII